jgi:hypothetical protein
MEKTNTEALEKLDERLKEAEKTEGESEISDALKAKANYLTRIGDKVRFTLSRPLLSPFFFSRNSEFWKSMLI